MIELAGIADKAATFSRAFLRFGKWDSGLKEILEAVDRAGNPHEHPYGHKGMDWCVKEARALAGEPDLLPGNHERVREFLDDYDRAWPEAQKRYDDMAGQWGLLRDNARKEGRKVFDMDGCGPLVDRMRDLADERHLTEEQKGEIAKAVRKWDDHQKELARSKSKSRGGGFGM